MTEHKHRVAVLYRGHELAEALASGLRLRGWLPHIPEDASRAVLGDQPVVLVEDDRGALPDLPPGVPRGKIRPNGHRVIAVAGPAALTAIVRIVAAGATAVNADQPYRRLLAAVHEALVGAPATLAQHSRLLADLRQRADESGRFPSLTPRECAVLADVASGRSAETIAGGRPVGLATVRSQIATVLRKLGVRSQPAAIALTYRSCVDSRIMDPLRRFHQNYG